MAPTDIELEAARDGAAERLAEIREDLEDAARRGDRQGLLAPRDELDELARQPEVSADALYWSAYADAMITGSTSDGEEELAREAVEHGIARMLAALESRPDQAEGLALLSLLRTQRLKLDGAAALTLAGPAREAMDRALELAPENPRVHMLHGVRLLHLPRLMGGNTGRAIEAFRRARTAFGEASPIGPLAPRWGEPDNLSWLALALLRTGDLEAAREAVDACKARWPEFAHVRDEVEPALAAEEKKRR